MKLEIMVELCLSGVSARRREEMGVPLEQQAADSDTPLILLVVLHFKRKKWLPLKKVF